MASKRYRTKPVEIEAIQYNGNIEALMVSTLGTDFEHAKFKGEKHSPDALSVYDELQDTWVKVNVGDYIIRGNKGEFYPCEAEVFEWKYEEVPAKVNKVKVWKTSTGPGD